MAQYIPPNVYSQSIDTGQIFTGKACGISLMDGWHDHNAFLTPLEISDRVSRANVPLCVLSNDINIRQRPYGDEDQCIKSICNPGFELFAQPYITSELFGRINWTPIVAAPIVAGPIVAGPTTRVVQTAGFLTNNGQYGTLTQQQLPLPPPSFLGAVVNQCCYRLTQAESVQIYKSYICSRYDVAHIITNSMSIAKEQVDDSDATPVARDNPDTNFSLIQYALHLLFDIKDNVYIFRDVAYGNYADDVAKFGGQYPAHFQTAPPENQEIISIANGSTVYDPGPSINPTTKGGIRCGFATAGGKSRYGIVSSGKHGDETITDNYPEYNAGFTAPTNACPENAIYSKFEMIQTLHTFFGNKAENGVTNANLSKYISKIRAELKIIEVVGNLLLGRQSVKRTEFIVRSGNAQKQTNAALLPLIDIITAYSIGGVATVRVSGVKSLLAKKKGDHGITLSTLHGIFQFMKIVPQANGTFNFQMDSTNQLHTFLSFDRVAIQATLEAYGAPIVIYNTGKGFVLFVSKKITSHYANPDTKLQNKKLEVTALKSEYDAYVGKFNTILTDYQEVNEKSRYIQRLVIVFLNRNEPTIYTDAGFQYLLAVYYILAPFVSYASANVDPADIDIANLTAPINRLANDSVSAATAAANVDIVNALIDTLTSSINDFKTQVAPKLQYYEQSKACINSWQALSNRLDVDAYDDVKMTGALADHKLVIGFLRKRAGSPHIIAEPYKKVCGGGYLAFLTKFCASPDTDIFNNAAIKSILNLLPTTFHPTFIQQFGKHFAKIRELANDRHDNVPIVSKFRTCVDEMFAQIPELGQMQFNGGKITGGNPPSPEWIATNKQFKYIQLMAFWKLFVAHFLFNLISNRGLYDDSIRGGILESLQNSIKFNNNILNPPAGPIVSNIRKIYYTPENKDVLDTSYGKLFTDIMSQLDERHWEWGWILTVINEMVNFDYANIDNIMSWLYKWIPYNNDVLNTDKKISDMHCNRFFTYCLAIGAGTRLKSSKDIANYIEEKIKALVPTVNGYSSLYDYTQLKYDADSADWIPSSKLGVTKRIAKPTFNFPPDVLKNGWSKRSKRRLSYKAPVLGFPIEVDGGNKTRNKPKNKTRKYKNKTKNNQ